MVGGCLFLCTGELQSCVQGLQRCLEGAWVGVGAVHGVDKEGVGGEDGGWRVPVEPAKGWLLVIEER